MNTSSYEHNKRIGFNGGTVNTNGMHHEEKKRADKAVKDGQAQASRR